MADPSSRAGTPYGTTAVIDFCNRVHAAHDEALTRAFESPAAEGMPPIQVGPSEGKLLHLLLRMIDARRVVEVGTLAGYSALWMARALPPGGKLYSIDIEPKHAAVARRNLDAAGLLDRVDLRVGPGLAVLADLAGAGPFDAVFLDADKAGYLEYARWAGRHLRPGGLLIADNSYFFGRLLDASPDAVLVRGFHELLPVDFDSVCIPTPDGLVLAIRR